MLKKRIVRQDVRRSKPYIGPRVPAEKLVVAYSVGRAAQLSSHLRKDIEVY